MRLYWFLWWDGSCRRSFFSVSIHCHHAWCLICIPGLQSPSQCLHWRNFSILTWCCCLPSKLIHFSCSFISGCKLCVWWALWKARWAMHYPMVPPHRIIAWSLLRITLQAGLAVLAGAFWALPRGLSWVLVHNDCTSLMLGRAAVGMFIKVNFRAGEKCMCSKMSDHIFWYNSSVTWNEVGLGLAL